MSYLRGIVIIEANLTGTKVYFLAAISRIIAVATFTIIIK
jgi:hypothetical protein